MSGSLESTSTTDELRRRFAVWTLAVLGTLSSSSTVQLQSPLWAADPPAGLPGDSPQPSAKDEAKTDTEPVKLNRQTLLKLMADKEFDKARQLVDAALHEKADVEQLQLALSLASNLARAQSEHAIDLYRQIQDNINSQLNDSPAPNLLTTYMLSTQGLSAALERSGKVDEAVDNLKKAIDKVSVVAPQAPMVDFLFNNLTQLQVEHGRTAEADALLTQRLENAKSSVATDGSPTNRSRLATAISNFANILGDQMPDKARALIAESQSQMLAAVEREEATVDDYRAYQSLQLALAKLTGESDAQAAVTILSELNSYAEKLAQRFDEPEAKKLKGAKASVDSALARAHSKLVHQQLIGQTAPDFQIEAVVNMPRVDWGHYKGKVVLIDFWAVWCGPCIATFPHLRHLHETYADQGLEIVGVTRPYGYVWDKDADSQVADKAATLDQELEMLEQFRLKHNLPYGFIVSPKESDYNKLFGVYGIPQAVVVDQEGKVQLIVSGSGEKSARQVEEKIKSLLDAKGPKGS